MGNLAELLRVPDIEAELSRIEEALVAAVEADDPFLTQIAGHLLSAGGKRLRPVLTAASAAACGAPITDAVVSGGVSVELVHLGSLYHDDVMDDAESRRGVESVNNRWGNLIAILAGDFLLARASEIAASLGTEVAGLLARTIGRLCQGQVGELESAFSVARTEDAYLRSIRGKTASLLSASCRIGALTSQLPPADTEALSTFGEHFGMVFQIVDDVLDVVGTDEQLGKPAGHDLVEGVYTLPVIRTLAHPEAGAELRDLLGRPLDLPERDKAREIVRAGDGIGYALAVGRRYADEAAAALTALDHPVAADVAGAGHRLLDTVAR